jgi:hypothetical protein
VEPGRATALGDAGVLVVQTPFQAPNANAHAERFVRSIKHECLDRMMPLGERHSRRALREFVHYYHCERNHHGLEKRLIDGSAPRRREGQIRRASAPQQLAELLRASRVKCSAAGCTRWKPEQLLHALLLQALYRPAASAG